MKKETKFWYDGREGMGEGKGEGEEEGEGGEGRGRKGEEGSGRGPSLRGNGIWRKIKLLRNEISKSLRKVRKVLEFLSI